MPDQFSNQTAGLIVWQHLIPLALAAFHGVAQQHTRQAKPPGMLPGRRKLELLDVVVINPPAHARFIHPLAKVAQPFLIDVEACGQHGNIQ